MHNPAPVGERDLVPRGITADSDSEGDDLGMPHTESNMDGVVLDTQLVFSTMRMHFTVDSNAGDGDPSNISRGTACSETHRM